MITGNFHKIFSHRLIAWVVAVLFYVAAFTFLKDFIVFIFTKIYGVFIQHN